jgi:predicted ATP-grasp superfamily ATP-dependent carboligase
VNVFVFEFLTGGGLYGSPALAPASLASTALASGIDAPSSLLAEGAAMLRYVVADLVALPGVHVRVALDRRVALDLSGVDSLPVGSSADLRRVLQYGATTADWTLVIAPEIDHQLTTISEQVQAAGGRLLGGTLDLIRLASDKHATADRLAQAGVAVPWGVAVFNDANDTDDPDAGPFSLKGLLRSSDAIGSAGLEWPLVLKPRWGAGSQVVILLQDADAARRLASKSTGPYRLETFHPGQPVSVAALCGPSGRIMLPPCTQRLSDDGRFTYLGGSTPLKSSLAERATRLAARALDALPAALGYVGVDLILAPHHDATAQCNSHPQTACDVVVEVNPRMTTSYVALRYLAQTNLAAAMLAQATGQRTALSFRDESVQFDADGTIRPAMRANRTPSR